MMDRPSCSTTTTTTTNNNDVITKPTEAQLRWCSFHKSRRAKTAQDKVRALYTSVPCNNNNKHLQLYYNQLDIEFVDWFLTNINTNNDHQVEDDVEETGRKLREYESIYGNFHPRYCTDWTKDAAAAADRLSSDATNDNDYKSYPISNERLYYLAAASRRYIDRKKNPVERHTILKSVFGYEPRDETERKERYNQLRQFALALQDSSADAQKRQEAWIEQLQRNNAQAAEAAREWAKRVIGPVDPRMSYEAVHHRILPKSSSSPTKNVVDNNTTLSPGPKVTHMLESMKTKATSSATKNPKMQPIMSPMHTNGATSSVSKSEKVRSSLRKESIASVSPHVHSNHRISPGRAEKLDFENDDDDDDIDNSEEIAATNNTIPRTQHIDKSPSPTDVKIPLHHRQDQKAYDTISPTLKEKLHKGIVSGIENMQWDLVSSLINENRWLAELTDPVSGQALLHPLALYGNTAPGDLLDYIYQCFPSGVHKFDNQGNLPLHMACGAGNMRMIHLFLEKFKSGASVRNDEGLLPLHFAVASGVEDAIKVLVNAFPSGAGISDAEGNLPLHLAASMQGEAGCSIVKLLLESNIDVRVESPSKVVRDSSDMDHFDAQETNHYVPTGMVKNKDGHTPLMVSIHSRSGWEVVETLLGGHGGEQAALECDDVGNSPIHYCTYGEFADPATVLSILKVVPHCATIPNNEGALPIELACAYEMPDPVILALVLVDLPFDLDSRDGREIREGYGGSWSFITCDCDDAFTPIVAEVIQMCSYQQVRELCFFKTSENQASTIYRATPEVKFELRKALRFVGRYEIQGGTPLYIDRGTGLKIFDATDFGPPEDPFVSSKRVLLRCYSGEEIFLFEIEHIKALMSVNLEFLEEASYFNVHDFPAYSSVDSQKQFCIVVERPSFNLARVVTGIPKNAASFDEMQKYEKYVNKVCMVLRIIGKALRMLHTTGFVHGGVTSFSCGRFGDQWKLMGIVGLTKVGHDMPQVRYSLSPPPEAVGLKRNLSVLKETIVADPACDIWGYGKLMYEVLVGEPLIHFKAEVDPADDKEALHNIASWDSGSLSQIADRLMEQEGLGELLADLITHCLCPAPEDRPKNMEEVLRHPFWKELRRRSKVERHSVNSFTAVEEPNRDPYQNSEVGEI